MAGLFGGLARAYNFGRVNRPRSSSRDRYWLTGKDTTAGVWMDADEAFRLSAVWACVTVIAKAIASSQWDVFSEAPNGDRTPMKATTVWRLLNLRPNDEMTPFAFVEAMLIVALIYGNFFAEIERDLMGRAVALWPLSPERCRLERDTGGRLVLKVSQAEGADVFLPYADVFHLHGPSIDGIAGFDTVTVAARSLARAAAAERFGAAFYGNGTAVGGILKSAGNVGDEALNDLRKQLDQQHKGPEKAFRFVVLAGGLELQKTTVDPEQAQYIEGLHQSVEEVCRWFGVPPHKIQHLVRSTFNNIEHQGLEFGRDALTPWCERARQEADWKLVPGSGRFLRTRIDIDWLTEGDAKSRAETDNILVTGGIMTRNQARRKRGWNSLGPDGDVPTVNPGTTALPKALAADPGKVALPPPETPPATEPEPADPAETPNS